MGTQIVSLILGIIFGASLILAGFADPDRIIKALRLKDMHIIRSLVVILIVALIGIILITLLSSIEISHKPAAIITLIIGGLLFGAGMGLTGYTPGTSLAGAASGKIDALILILGMFFGAYVFVFIYPPAILPLEAILNYGNVTLSQTTNTSDILWLIIYFSAGTFILFLTFSKMFKKNKNEEIIENLHKDEIAPDEQLLELLLNDENTSMKTDSFEAIQILGIWKNILFGLIIICLILMQVIFWLVSKGNIVFDTENIINIPFGITFGQVKTILNISNVVIMLSSFLYVFIFYFCLSCSLSSNLGGIRYISRAFFSAILFIVLLFPWQIIFRSILLGAVYTPNELLLSQFFRTGDASSAVLLYLRFIGYWFFVLFLLIRSMVFSKKWSNSLFGRIEQII